MKQSSFFWGTIVGNVQVLAGLYMASRLGVIGAFLSSILIYWIGLYIYDFVTEKLGNKE